MARPVDQSSGITKVVELRAVQPGFPFYGRLTLQDGRPYSHDLLIHVADGWAARNIKHLDLRESEEMREDREYLDRVAAGFEDVDLPAMSDRRGGRGPFPDAIERENGGFVEWARKERAGGVALVVLGEQHLVRAPVPEVAQQRGEVGRAAGARDAGDRSCRWHPSARPGPHGGQRVLPGGADPGRARGNGHDPIDRARCDAKERKAASLVEEFPLRDGCRSEDDDRVLVKPLAPALNRGTDSDALVEGEVQDCLPAGQPVSCHVESDTVGLGDAFRKIGKRAVVAIREPSLGPCFGMKGGAAGGGYAPVERFAKFSNMPELGQMVRQVMDVVKVSDLDYIQRPAVEGGGLVTPDAPTGRLGVLPRS